MKRLWNFFTVRLFVLWIWTVCGDWSNWANSFFTLIVAEIFNNTFYYLNLWSKFSNWLVLDLNRSGLNWGNHKDLGFFRFQSMKEPFLFSSLAWILDTFDDDSMQLLLQISIFKVLLRICKLLLCAFLHFSFSNWVV